MLGILVTTIIAFALAIPLIWVVRSDRKLTWTSAVLLGTLLSVIGLLLIADVPSRILYYFDSQHEVLSRSLPGFLGTMMEGDDYVILRDIIVNTVQGIFVVVIFAAAYLWGERHRREGRFSK